jgi:protein SDA1
LSDQVFPALLDKKDRGRGADLTVQPKAFGEKVVAEGISGVELLAAGESGSDEDEDEEEIGDEEESDSDEEMGSVDEEGVELSEAEDSDGDIEVDTDEAVSDLEGEGFITYFCLIRMCVLGYLSFFVLHIEKRTFMF